VRGLKRGPFLPTPITTANFIAPSNFPSRPRPKWNAVYCDGLPAEIDALPICALVIFVPCSGKKDCACGPARRSDNARRDAVQGRKTVKVVWAERPRPRGFHACVRSLTAGSVRPQKFPNKADRETADICVRYSDPNGPNHRLREAAAEYGLTGGTTGTPAYRLQGNDRVQQNVLQYWGASHASPLKHSSEYRTSYGR
jgi:hypothetical protein